MLHIRSHMPAVFRSYLDDVIPTQILTMRKTSYGALHIKVVESCGLLHTTALG